MMMREVDNEKKERKNKEGRKETVAERGKL